MSKSGYNEDTIPEEEGQKRPMRLTRWEMETTIHFDMEQKTAILYTRDRTIMRKLDQLVKKCPDAYKLIRETDIDKTYEFPKKLIGYRIPRVLTEEQRQAGAKRLEKARKKKQEKGLENEFDGNYDGEGVHSK